MSGLRDLAAVINDGQEPRQRIAFVEGTVDTVTPGGAADGHAQVAVIVGVDTLLAMYLDSYTPTAGDYVEVLLVDGSPRILGRLIGRPTI